MTRTAILILVFLGLACSVGVPAVAAEPQPVKARLICELASLPPGSTATLAVAFELQPGWHLYWKGTNDSGMPVTLTPELPDGFTAREIEWPAPARHIDPGDIVNHIYEKSVQLLMPVDVPATAKPGQTVTIKVAAKWMACKSACVLGSADLSIDLPVSKDAPKASADAPLIRSARERMPRPWPADDKSLGTGWNGETLVIEAAGASKIAFFPGEGAPTTVDIAADGEVKGPRLAVRFRDLEKISKDRRLTGVVMILRAAEKDPRYYRLDVALPRRE